MTQTANNTTKGHITTKQSKHVRAAFKTPRLSMTASYALSHHHRLLGHRTTHSLHLAPLHPSPPKTAFQDPKTPATPPAASASEASSDSSPQRGLCSSSGSFYCPSGLGEKKRFLFAVHLPLHLPHLLGCEIFLSSLAVDLPSVSIPTRFPHDSRPRSPHKSTTFCLSVQSHRTATSPSTITSLPPPLIPPDVPSEPEASTRSHSANPKRNSLGGDLVGT
jgi:hypothetical protein